jgi:DNA-binding NarL/FixJ family response regulator
MLLAGLESLVARDGALTVVETTTRLDDLVDVLDAVAAGLVVIPAGEVAALQSAPPRSLARLASQAQSAALSPREREILGLLAEGLGNKIVAARLGISEHTVKTHVASIFTKLGAETRAEAVAIGARTGVILL